MRNVLSSLFIFIALTCPAQHLRDLYQQGLEAYEKGDYECFRQKMYIIDSMRPNYPAVVYNLAGGYALTGNKAKAIETLNKYILMDATQDFSKDKDFKSLLDDPEFDAIVKKQSDLTDILKPQKTLNVPILDAHPESIAYSKSQDAFFLGGVRDGYIWKIIDGADPIRWALSPKNSWCVMGLTISPDERFLWVCTSAMTNYADFNPNEKGFASVLKYDLSTTNLLETYVLNDGHHFGDLITDKQGNVYISDGEANKIYRIAIDDGHQSLVEWTDLSESIFNLQGLAFNKDETTLYISDYIDGIYALDVKSKTLKKLSIDAPNILLKGIDGLYYQDHSLIGLHNGTKPNRLVKYDLSKDGKSIIGRSVLAQGGQLNEPTQGTWIEQTFYFIMNSPWSAYDENGNFSPQEDLLVIGIID